MRENHVPFSTGEQHTAITDHKQFFCILGIIISYEFQKIIIITPITVLVITFYGHSDLFHGPLQRL